MRLLRIGVVAFALGWALASSIRNNDWIGVIVITAALFANMLIE